MSINIGALFVDNGGEPVKGVEMQSSALLVIQKNQEILRISPTGAVFVRGKKIAEDLGIAEAIITATGTGATLRSIVSDEP